MSSKIIKTPLRADEVKNLFCFDFDDPSQDKALQVKFDLCDKIFAGWEKEELITNKYKRPSSHLSNKAREYKKEDLSSDMLLPANNALLKIEKMLKQITKKYFNDKKIELTSTIDFHLQNFISTQKLVYFSYWIDNVDTFNILKEENLAHIEIAIHYHLDKWKDSNFSPNFFLSKEYRDVFITKRRSVARYLMKLSSTFDCENELFELINSTYKEADFLIIEALTDRRKTLQSIRRLDEKKALESQKSVPTKKKGFFKKIRRIDRIGALTKKIWRKKIF